MGNRAEELITQLEAEIVKRDARIAELEAQMLDVSAERNTCQRSRITATNGWKRECGDADSIFEALGIDTDAARTDGGSLRVASVIAALKAQQPSAGVVQGIDIDAAAKALAQCMDYPWDFMPERGREAMREHVRSVIGAALLNHCRAQAVPDGLCFKDSQELAEALGAVKCLHDMSVELIAERVFAQRGEC